MRYRLCYTDTAGKARTSFNKDWEVIKQAILKLDLLNSPNSFTVEELMWVDRNAEVLAEIRQASTQNSERQAMPIIEIFKTFRFEASHVLPKHEGKCSRLHGHSWELRIGVSGPVDPETGFVVDYAKLKRLVNDELVDRIDHTHLGCGMAYTRQAATKEYQPMESPFFGQEFYPSSENLVVAIAKVLSPFIAELGNNVQLTTVTLNETCTSQAIWSQPYGLFLPL